MSRFAARSELSHTPNLPIREKSGHFLAGKKRDAPNSQPTFFDSHVSLVVSTHLKNISENGKLPQEVVKIKHV